MIFEFDKFENNSSHGMQRKGILMKNNSDEKFDSMESTTLYDKSNFPGNNNRYA